MITYITVHGTGDGERPDDGGERQWWRANSDFSSELLAKSPPGSHVEPFLWSGANDEIARRDGAEKLLARLHRADAAGERVHLIGHSHGGSVIALALRFAAADGRKLSSLAGFTTIGTPFLALKLAFSPWGRFGSLGKALFTFLIPASVFFIIAALAFAWQLLEAPARQRAGEPLFDGLTVFFGIPMLLGGGVVAAVCLFGLMWLRRSRRGLFGKQTMRRLEQRYRSQWLGLYSRHDEAIAGLAAAAKLNARVFDRKVLQAPLAYAALALFLLPIVTVWGVFIVEFFVEELAPYEALEPIVPLYSDSFFGAAHASVHYFLGSWLQLPLQAHLELVSALRNFWFSSTFGGVLDEPSYNAGRAVWVIASVGFPLTLLGGYALSLTLWLWLVDLFALHIAGPLTARMLNNSIRGALLDRAYGSHTVAERALNASNSPFAAVQARVMPEEIDGALFDHALAGAGETFRKMREDIFAADRAGFDPIDSALKNLTWSELVHTCYFRVATARAYLAAAAAEHALACANAGAAASATRTAQAEASVTPST